MEVHCLHAHCPRCGHDQGFRRAEVNHPLHLLLTILTLGLWSLCWISLVIGNHYRPWRCQQCSWTKRGNDTDP